MSEKDKELKDRYIYEVIRKIPKDQREDISMELNELIGDMYEAGGEKSMEQVLMELGDPAEFARRYRDDKRCLISSEYYDNYIWVLQIVIFCVAASALLSALVQGIMNIRDVSGIYKHGTETFSDLVVSLIMAFGGVTFVFAVLERMKVKVDLKEHKKWSVEHLQGAKKIWTPRDLKPVPDKRALISRGECIAGMIFCAVFSGVLVFAPELIGAYVKDGGEYIRIPMFNMEMWHILLPLLLLLFGVGFVDEVVRLFEGRYNRAVLLSSLITNLLQFVLTVILVKFLPLWNENFVTDLQNAMGKKEIGEWDLFFYWGTDMFTNIFLGIVIFASVMEIGTAVYKTMRYGKHY